MLNSFTKCFEKLFNTVHFIRMKKTTFNSSIHLDGLILKKNKKDMILTLRTCLIVHIWMSSTNAQVASLVCLKYN